MPTFIIGALIAGGAAAGAAAIAGTAVLAAFQTAFIASLIIGGISRATQKKAKKPDNAVVQQDSPVTIRQAASPWQVVAGLARVGGVLTFRYISPDRRFWHMVVTMACHPSQAVDEIWFNDEKLALDSSGNALGRFAKSGPVTVSTFNATVPGSPFQVTVPGSVFGVAIVNIFVTGVRREVHDSTPNAPQTIYQYTRSGSTFTFHSGAAGKSVEIKYYDAALSTGSWVRVKISLGDEGAAQPFPDLVSESGGRWSSAHLQQGHTKIYVRLEANPDVFPTGVPNVTVVMRGAKIYDPRTGLTAYSNNAALWVSHYLTESALGYGVGAVYADEIHEADLISAANSCDEAVSIVAGGSEPRYTVNGSFLVSEQPKTVLERLLAASGGTLVDLGDRWRINAAVYHVPTVTLTESHLAGASSINPHLPISQDANGVKGIYTSPNDNWQPQDFPAYAPATYLDQDDGERRWKDIDLSGFVTSASQAQRLAKIDLLRTRTSLTEEAPFKLYAWQVVPGRSVARTDTQLGWSAKAFEVVDSELSIVSDAEDAPTLAVRLTLKETSAAVYDWTTAEEQLDDIAPNTDLPDPTDIPAPGAPEISEDIYETRDGRGVAAKAIVSYAQSDYPFRASYQLEYKLSSATDYTVLPAVQISTDSTDPVTQEILDIEPGIYDFRVLAITSIGVRSAYASTLGQEILGLGPAPAALTGLSIQAGGGTARLKFDQHPELDVRRGGRILVRFCHEGVTSAWESAFSIGEPEGWPGDSTQIDVPLKPGTYLLKPRDSTGHECETWTEISTKQASVLEFTGLGTIIEDTAFPGTHSGTAPVDGMLTLGGVGLFDDIPDFDSVSDLDGYGGIATTGTYTFSTATDLGAVNNVRLTSRLEGAIDNLLDLIDDRAGNIDDWADFEGATFGGSSADAWVETRHTDDDPAGAPAWSAWKRLDAAEFEARAFQYRAILTSADPAYRPEISVLRVIIEEVV